MYSHDPLMEDAEEKFTSIPEYVLGSLLIPSDLLFRMNKNNKIGKLPQRFFVFFFLLAVMSPEVLSNSWMNKPTS